MAGFRRTFYDVLEVAPTATTADIRRQYLKLANTCHPDKGGSSVAFRNLQKAYRCLSNKQQRRTYDKILQQNFAPAPEWIWVGGIFAAGVILWLTHRHRPAS
jgi:DnaJ-class molecular chaperone